MINWRDGKGGFVGGLKYLVKGVFQFAHSLTSVAPVGPSPDCITAFIGALDSKDAVFIGLINDTNAEIGALDAGDAVFIGALDADDATFIGPIDPDNSFIGAITDETAFNGDLCDD